MSEVFDLYALSSKVRNESTKTYIREAIYAFNNSAYRAAIVSTWIAVVYDIISKIRELADSGDKSAKVHIAKIDKAIREENIKSFLEIEKNILSTALDEFELFSKYEYIGLKRLQDDRNLCAHPAFSSSDFLFQPSPELVRTHISHAIVCLLQHPPIQGKYLIEKIIEDMRSIHYPPEFESSKIYLINKYFSHMKQSALRNLTIELLRELFYTTDYSHYQTVDIIVSGIICINDYNSSVFIGVMSEKLQTMLDNADNKSFMHIMGIIDKIPSILNIINDAAIIRINELAYWLDSGDFSHYGMINALKYNQFKNTILEIFNRFNNEEKISIIASCPNGLLIDETMELFSKVRSYASAQNVGKRIIASQVKYMSIENIKRLIEIIKNNDQIYGAGLIGDTINEIYNGTDRWFFMLKKEWEDLIMFLYINDSSAERKYRSILTRLQENGYAPRCNCDEKPNWLFK